MRIFTRLGIAFLLVVFTTGSLLAQKSPAEIAAKNQTLLQVADVTTTFTKPNVTPTDDPWDLQLEFDATAATGAAGNAGAECDGEFYYTTRWASNLIHKYDMDGNLVEEFSIPGVTGLRDLAYDGTYFYGGNAGNSIYEMDFTAKTLVSTISSGQQVRAIAYDAGQDAFWVANFSTDMTLVDKTGTTLENIPNATLGTSGMYGAAYDNWTPGGPYLWIADQGDGAGTAQFLHQIDLNTLAPAGFAFDLLTLLGPNASALSGGLFTIPDVYTGTASIGGLLQGVPDDFFMIELAATGPLPDDDIAVQTIMSPNTGGDLSSAEIVTVKIKNIGNNPQTGFDVSYTMDGGTAIVETISATLNSGETLEHTFAGTVDLSAYGFYEFEACTDLTGDENTDNDCKSKTVENFAPSYCDASTTTEDEWIANVLCGSIDNASGWQGGVADYTAMSTAIPAGGSEAMTVTNGNAWAADIVYAWVDWNDDMEWAIDEEFQLENVGGTGATFTGDITAPADAAAGMHRMRVRMTYSTPPVPCDVASYGEVEDYSIMVGDPVYGNLEGTVTAEGGAAIEGATVMVAGMTETTDADGMYSFMDISIGTYTVSCSAAGYVSESATALIEDGMTTTVDFELAEEGTTPGDIVFEDDFESYNAGEMIACQNPEDWTTWANDPCGADDADVSDEQAYSGSNSVKIITNDDVVMDLDTYLTSGTHTVSVMIYVPTGGDAYYNILSAFVPAPEWAFEVYFNAGGDAAVSAGGTAAATFNYAFDTWIESKVVVDLNADWAEYFVDGTSIIAWQWTAGASGAGNALQIGALDFFGATATTVYYFDNMLIESAAALAAPTNFTAEVVGGDDVEMNWVAPGGLGYIQWDAGTNEGDGIGLTNGGSFNCASRWTPADLTPYDGNYMTSITIFPNGDPAATFVLKAWTGANAGTEIMSQVVASTNVDEFNEIALDTPIMIDASQELWFGYECTHAAGTFPAGTDAGPAVQGFGDMLSTDGSTWVGMSAEYGLDYNWNIAGYLTASDNGKDIAKPMVKQSSTLSNGTPVASGSNGTMAKMDNNATKGFIGFNVYRDGAVIAEEIGESTYTDMDLAPGTYTFEVKAVYDEGLSASAEPGPETLEIGDLVPRDHVIVEIGTGTWCQFCPGAAMGADEMHEEGLAVGIIEYHSGDNYETTESAARLAYYGITGYPTAYFDGVISVVGGNATQSMYATYLPKYEQRIGTPTVFEIESYYYNTTGNDYEVYISVEMIDTYANLDNLKVFAALTESHIPEVWLGQTELNFVCRDMIPDASGSDADFSSSTTQTYTLGFSIPAAYVMSNLEMVVFIQDIASTEVLQGTLAPFSPVGVEETMDNTIAIYPNPATDVVNITSGSEIRSITVYNNVGQVVAIENVESNIYRINTSDYETGIYFLQLETEEGMISKRVIIE